MVIVSSVFQIFLCFSLWLDISVDISSMFPVSSIPACHAHWLYLKMEDMGAAETSWLASATWLLFFFYEVLSSLFLTNLSSEIVASC